MKIDDFKKRFNSILENPDTGVADAPAFLEEVEADYTSAGVLAEKVTELENRVKDLQEANIKLYLAQTREAPEEDDTDEEDGEAYIDTVFNNLLKESEEE